MLYPTYPIALGVLTQYLSIVLRSYQALHDLTPSVAEEGEEGRGVLLRPAEGPFLVPATAHLLPWERINGQLPLRHLQDSATCCTP